jgi:hypothetical protein
MKHRFFFKALPNKTLAFKNEPCNVGKISKDRVSVLLHANRDGMEKQKPLVIGKSKKLRCFGGVKSLPVIYEHNTKSWMTSSSFKTGCTGFTRNSILRKEKLFCLWITVRHILP